MKKRILWAFAAILTICSASVLTACSSDDDNQTDPKLVDNIVGKWLYVEYDEQTVETEESSVTTFVKEGSTLKAYISQSSKKYDLWVHNQPAEVKIDGNKITITMHSGNVTTVEEMTDITVNDNDLRYTSKYTVYKNEKVFDDMIYQLRCIKVKDDYSKIFIGRWEGTITSDEPGYTPRPFCEEYLTDGTNIEYELIDNQWVRVEADYAEYFIDGNLLCTRWKYPGKEEERENSIFASYDNGIMIIKEVVVRNDKLYTETSTLRKVVK